MTCSPQRHRREEQSLNLPWSRSEGVLATTAIVNTFVVSRSLYGRRVQRVLSLHFFSRQRSFSSSNQPSIRCNSPSHSKRNQPLAQQEHQPSQQELSAFNTAGGSIVPRHSTSNYPSTSKRNQSSPSKRNQPSHSRCNESSPSKRIQFSPTGDSFSQLSCRPAATGA